MLQFFLSVPRSQLARLIQNCEYCLGISNPARFLDIQREYEQFLEVKIA
jgi:hypothetical protein